MAVDPSQAEGDDEEEDNEDENEDVGDNRKDDTDSLVCFVGTCLLTSVVVDSSSLYILLHIHNLEHHCFIVILL